MGEVVAEMDVRGPVGSALAPLVACEDACGVTGDWGGGAKRVLFPDQEPRPPREPKAPPPRLAGGT